MQIFQPYIEDWKKWKDEADKKKKPTTDLYKKSEFGSDYFENIITGEDETYEGYMIDSVPHGAGCKIVHGGSTQLSGYWKKG